jgi:hypothetical protein
MAGTHRTRVSESDPSAYKPKTVTGVMSCSLMRSISLTVSMFQRVCQARRVGRANSIATVTVFRYGYVHCSR